MAALGQDARPLRMAKSPAKKVITRFKKPKGLPNLKGWRMYRNGMTAEQLAERTGLTPGFLSQLQNGQSGYTQDTLELLAEALQCRPGDLINVDPSKEGAIWSLWDSATVAEKAQIVAVTQAIVKKAAGAS